MLPLSEEGQPIDIVTMSSHSAFTVVTWTSAMMHGYYYAILEAGVQIFGNSVFVAKDTNNVTDTYAKGVLISQENGVPVFLRLYTERDIVCVLFALST